MAKSLFCSSTAVGIVTLSSSVYTVQIGVDLQPHSANKTGRQQKISTQFKFTAKQIYEFQGYFHWWIFMLIDLNKIQQVWQHCSLVAGSFYHVTSDQLCIAL